MTITKTIYPSRKGKTAKDISDILNLEISEHLRNNPNLKFVKLDGVVTNTDKSKTYTILFASAT